MADGGGTPSASRPTKAERRAAREAVGEYHAAEQAKLIDHVRAALAHFDAGQIDAFEFDEIVHQYHRASQKLWSFVVGSGSDAVRTARTIEWARAEGELTDWWAVGEPRRRR